MKKSGALIILLLAMTMLVGCGPVAEPVQTTDPVTQPTETEVPPETAVTDMESLYFGMKNVRVPDLELELDYRNRYIMALDHVEVKGIPSDLAATNRVLNRELVKLHAAVYSDDEKWALVSYCAFDGGDNIGWVRVSGLAEYTEDSKETLLFPVNVSDNCKDVETGENVGKDDWRITAIDGEYAAIVRVGERSNKVSVKDILYPSTAKTSTDPWLPTTVSGEALPYFGMRDGFDSEFPLDHKNHYIMALENVEVKGVPTDSVATNDYLDRELVTVRAAARRDDETWVLVSYHITDGYDNMGWVKVSGLTEYTEEMKALLRYPVTVREGCKDVETGKELGQYDYARSNPEGEVVEIGNEFGVFKVKPEDIVYPSTKKTTDERWGEWEE